MSACLLSLTIWSCGAATYEERLGQTAELFDYLHTVDSNLAAPAWDRRDLGMAMRVPKPFDRPLPGPERTVNEEGEEFFGPDLRHPDVLGIDLPGLEEAWQASLDDESGEQQEGRFYILTNHQRARMQSDGGPPAAEFLQDLEQLLMNAFRVTIPDGEAPQPGDNLRSRYIVPARGSVHAKFNAPKDYQIIRFVPDGSVGGRPLQGLLFARTSGNVQVAILLLAPPSLSRSFRQNLDLALQTLQISAQAPSAAPGPGGQPRPSGAGSGF